jgi:hypothetical protein
VIFEENVFQFITVKPPHNDFFLLFRRRERSLCPTLAPKGLSVRYLSILIPRGINSPQGLKEDSYANYRKTFMSLNLFFTLCHSFKGKVLCWGCSSVIELLLNMCESLGSIPHTSKTFVKIDWKTLRIFHGL